MVADVARLLLGGLLVVSALAKLASPAASAAALATFGLHTLRLRHASLAGLIATELLLGAGVIAGLAAADYLAALLLGAFTSALILALQRGRAGAPCACFGPRSQVSRPAVVRSALLALAFAALPLLA